MADNLEDEWWIDDKTEKQDVVMECDATVTEKVSTDDTKKQKKRKRNRNKKKITEELKEKGDSLATPTDVTNYLKKRFDGTLTPVEMDDLSLDADKHFFKAESDPKFPVAYLKSILPKWKKLTKGLTAQGSPLLLIVSSAAIRSVNLNRDIVDFKGEGCKCAKLFAKHMKVEDQQKFLKKTVCHIALGTPNRIVALFKSGHLKTDKLVAVILDWNWRDIKKRRLMDGPETRKEILTLLQSYIIPSPQDRQVSRCNIRLELERRETEKVNGWTRD